MSRIKYPFLYVCIDFLYTLYISKICSSKFLVYVCMFIYIYTCTSAMLSYITSLPSPYPAGVLRANRDRADVQYNRDGRQRGRLDALAVLSNAS